MIAWSTRQLPIRNYSGTSFVTATGCGAGRCASSRPVQPARASLYELLGVDRSASSADIRSAYRRLATLYHPDVNPSVTAHERFQVRRYVHRTWASCGSSSSSSNSSSSSIWQ
ncbi:hypothetical protein COO60DRAFT_1542664 [Scenedesmus sp. NREL 46B-D3]|nr:hypothetical protein COO60DRAFT_1542664 [Scenedesmus sp. NREL 46B-D3]